MTVDDLHRELNAKLNHYISEGDFSYAELVGTLELLKEGLIKVWWDDKRATGDDK